MSLLQLISRGITKIDSVGDVRPCEKSNYSSMAISSHRKILTYQLKVNQVKMSPQKIILFELSALRVTWQCWRAKRIMCDMDSVGELSTLCLA